MDVEQDREYIQLQILTFLQDKDFTSTLEISKAVFGKGSTKKMINTHLYSLLKQGQVEKQAEDDGTKPQWKIKN